MPSVTLDAVEQMFVFGLGGPGAQMQRNINASVANNQATGFKIISEGNHVDQSVGTGSLVLPSVGSMEASTGVLIMNDTANALNLFPALGETINALGANASFSITAGQSAIAIRAGSPLGARGVATVSGLNWRVGLIP